MKALTEIHKTGILSDLIQQGAECSHNPLLKMSRNVNIEDVAKLAEESPEFYNAMIKVQKLHGCHTYLDILVNRKYPLLFVISRLNKTLYNPRCITNWCGSHKSALVSVDVLKESRRHEEAHTITLCKL